MGVHIATVYKSGGEYKREHVEALRKQVKKYLPKSKFYVLTDDLEIEGAIPLQHDWPKWWPKIELFRADMPWNLKGEPCLYLDLDTLLVGDTQPLVREKKDSSFLMLQDFYRARWASGLMRFWGADLELVYNIFSKNPEFYMSKFERGGDQAYIQMVLLNHNIRPNLFQSVFPGLVCSYKVHCRDRGHYPAGVGVVCFHGRPRPWECQDEWVMELLKTKSETEESSTPSWYCPNKDSFMDEKEMLRLYLECGQSCPRADKFCSCRKVHKERGI